MSKIKITLIETPLSKDKPFNKTPNNIGRGLLSPLMYIVEGPINSDIVHPVLTVNKEIGLRGLGKVSGEGIVTDLQIDSFNLVSENIYTTSEEEDEVIWQRNKSKIGPYDNPENGCPNCGRHRVMLGNDGKHRCEKCAWCIEDNKQDNEFWDHLH